MKIITQLFITLLVHFAFAPYAVAATLEVNEEGLLTGARNVSVAGILYDVAFLEGSFNELFCNGGCIDTTSLSSSMAFSQSLLDQVFVNVAAGQFDTDPTETYGCNYFERCYVMTPYGTEIYSWGGITWLGSFASNDYMEASDYTHSTSGEADYNSYCDCNGLDATVYAHWSLSAPEVPLPAAAWLMGSGLIGLAGISRRRS